MDRDQAILDYLQNRLDPTARDRFEATMADDTSLAAEVDLMRSVRADLANGPKHENADAVWDKISATINTAPQAANENRPPWMQVLQYAAVALLAVASWQFAVVPRIADTPDVFRTASEASDAVVLQVKFADSATIAQIGAVLAEINGTISDGPSTLGIVRVSFADEGVRQQAFETLTERSALVEFVQPQ